MAALRSEGFPLVLRTYERWRMSVGAMILTPWQVAWTLSLNSGAGGESAIRTAPISTPKKRALPSDRLFSQPRA